MGHLKYYLNWGAPWPIIQLLDQKQLEQVNIILSTEIKEDLIRFMSSHFFSSQLIQLKNLLHIYTAATSS